MSKDPSANTGGVGQGSEGLAATQPLEAMYALRVAAEMIPMPSVHALYQFLFKHRDEFPGRYRRTGWYEVRLLTESEIVRIREMTIHNFSRSRYTRSGRPPGTALAGVIRRALSNE